MELWMRSQDKTDLMKVKNICMTKGDYDEIGIFVNGCLFGQYKTKERALEILDEIQEHLLKIGENEILTDKIGIMNGIKHYGIVYEMPEE